MPAKVKIIEEEEENNDYNEEYDDEPTEYFNNKKKNKIINEFPDIKTLRVTTLNKINKFIKNKKISEQIEAGIMKFTNKTCTKKICYEAIYQLKSNNLIANMDPDSQIANTKFIDRILKKKLKFGGVIITDYETIAFMKPQEIFPEKWADEENRKKIKEDKSTNLATTDAYPCPECKARRASVSPPIQIRSADEPMTVYVTCLNCNHVSRIN
jgi:DNA-directed RNA polymerase subunit M/transcription elongation factor TFIIS